MKTLILSLLSAVIMIGQAYGETKYKVGDCDVTEKEAAESKLMYEIRESTESGVSNRGQLRIDMKSGLPDQGFNLCEGHDSGPVKITQEEVGDYKRFKFSCGGTFERVQGKAEFVLNKKTKKMEYIEIETKGAYTTAFYPRVPLHSGPIKGTIDNFSCANSAYKKETFQIVDGVNALQRQPIKQEFAVLYHREYVKVPSSEKQDELSDEFQSRPYDLGWPSK
jgi:hypothetical protein